MLFPFTSLRKPTTRPPIPGVFLLSWFLRLAILIPRGAAASVNRTIDDTFGDPITGLHPTYGPNPWDDNFCGVFALLTTECGSGTWAPNPADAFNQTFQFTFSANEFLSLEFTGTAIYVYTLVINSAQHNIGPEAAFGGAGFTAQIDSGQVEVDSGGSIDNFPALPAYNVLLYSKTGLENIAHTLTIMPIKSGQLLFFDYAVYTFEDSGSSPSGSPGSSPSGSPGSSPSGSPGSSPSGSPGSSPSSGASGSSPSSGSSSSPSRSFSPSSPSPPTQSGASSSSSASPSPSAVTSSAIASAKKKPLAGAIAGGVIGGLLLILGFLLYYVARRRKTATLSSASRGVPREVESVEEKRPAPWPQNPIPRNMTPTAGFIYTGWAPQSWSEAAVTPRRSFANTIPVPGSVPRSSTQESPPSPLGAEEEKTMLQLTRQEAAGRQIALLEDQIRDLMEAARPSLPSESLNTSTPRPPPNQLANAQLVAQITALREQIEAIQNEIQIPELPEYSVDDTAAEAYV
ncbi:hypothetical protein C8R45DRAFT_479272 [Mycena sanguinolenta]|nr:hypothetical protein C8R45DRAFT_479272 [Mycena sanguinolenta]